VTRLPRCLFNGLLPDPGYASPCQFRRLRRVTVASELRGTLSAA